MSDINYSRKAKCLSCDWQGNDWDCEKTESKEIQPGQFNIETNIERLDVGQVNIKSEDKKEVNNIAEQVDQDKKEVEDYKANKEYQDRAYNLALAFHDIMGDRWFTLDRASRKTKEKEIVVFQKLKLLELFGHCTIKRGDDNNKDQRGKPVFKVYVTKERELQAVDELINSLRQHLTQTLAKKNGILAEIEAQKQKELLSEN